MCIAITFSSLLALLLVAPEEKASCEKLLFLASERKGETLNIILQEYVRCLKIIKDVCCKLSKLAKLNRETL